ncbi:MAG: hypothetical protein JRF39_06840 [Deltaproteobacteria bacterium]|nr:hypothetical protein [Deltaproteobacteria bacterium]
MESRAPKSPLAVYLLIWVILGFYAIYWYFRAVSYLNSIDQEHSQSIRKIASFVSVFLALYLTGFAIVFVQHKRGVFLPEQPARQALLDLLFLMAVRWNVLAPVVVVRLATRMRRVQEEDGIVDTASPGRTLLAYFLWFLAFPYLQYHLNRLAEVRLDA